MEKATIIKTGFYGAICALGGAIGNLVGGFDKLFIALIVCMVVDYFSGILVAAVFKKSPKTESGALESNAGLKGLVKKIFILLIVAVSVQIDIVLNSSFVRNAVILGFIANEALSIIENGGLMGFKYPPALVNAIDILKKKSESIDNA